jgi:putative transposase
MQKPGRLFGLLSPPRSSDNLCYNLIALLVGRRSSTSRVLNAYVAYFNQARPHQGIGQQIPDPSGPARSSHQTGDKVIALPVLSGLHHDYHWAA